MHHDPQHRRDFVRSIALGGATGLWVNASSARADDPKPKDDKPPPPPSETDARMAMILARFGKHLDEDARKAVRAELEGIIRRGDSMRKFALDNGDGPCPLFQPFRGPLAENPH